MKKWYGRVIEIDASSGIFTAALDGRDGDPNVLADFEIAELGERTSPEVGDVIYVTVTSGLTQSGYPKRTATVRLRRIGFWSAEEVAGHWQRASQRLSKLRARMLRDGEG